MWTHFLKGFDVVSLSPAPRHRSHSLGTLTLEYPIDIAPDGSKEFEFTLRATKPGVYIGDVDV